MLRLAYKSVKHNPKRLILTSIAVALGVSLVATTQIFTNSLSSGFNSLFEEIFTSVDVVVEADPDADFTREPGQLDLDTSVLDAVRGVDGVSVAEPGVGVETGFLLNEEGDGPLNMGGAPTLVYNWTGVPEIDRSTLIDGRAPESSGEAVLDIDTADRFELGDTISIAAGTGVQTYELVGTVRFGESNSLQTANLVYLIEDDVRELGGGLVGYNGVEVLAAEGVDVDALAQRIDEAIPDELRAVTAAEKAEEQSEAFDEVLQYIDIFTLAFAIIALFVGAYIIVNTFRTIVTQRTREFGLLRAVGVSGTQVRNVILLEGAIVGLVASTLGLLGGWLLALILVAIVELGAGDIFGAVVLPLSAVLWGYGLGMLVTLVSALLPAIHASNISPMEALRESGTQSKKSLTTRTIVGSAMSLLALLAINIGLLADVERPYIYVGAGAIVLILGVTLVAAHLLVPVAGGLRQLLTAVFGVDGKIAANNIRREPRRSANAASALMIGVMLLALVATFTESLKSTFTDQFETNEADLFLLAMQAEIPQGAIDVISETDGVEVVARLTFDSVTHDGVNRTLSQIDVEEFEGLFSIPTDRPISELGDGVFVDLVMVEAGVEVGDTITLVGDRSTKDLEVTGIYEVAGDTNFFVNWDVGSELTSEPFIVQSLVKFDDSADTVEVSDRVKDNLRTDYPLVSVQSPDELSKFFTDFIDQLLGVISALLGSALIIAILGVANTLLLSVAERTREIGLLRAVGLRKRSVWLMITVESMVMAVFGTILGMVLGVSLGAALVLALEDFGFSGVTIPWLWLLVYTVAAALAGILAAVWPAWRASRLDILKAIATDG